MGGQVKPKRRTGRFCRRGSATIDYFLIVAILFPLAALVLHFGPRAMHAVYDMLTVVVAWPFL
jgi:hypothetical protein